MRLLSLVALGALLPAAAYATPITYTSSVTASGSLGGRTFSNQVVLVSGSADTADVTRSASGVYTVLTSASLTIGSGSAVAFTDVIQVANNPSYTNAGFGDVTQNLGVLFTTASAFSGYNLQTNIAQSGTAGINSGYSFGTTGGAFILNSASGSSRFTATLSSVAVTPEPSSLYLLGTGVLACVGGVHRRFRGRTT